MTNHTEHAVCLQGACLDGPLSDRCEYHRDAWIVQAVVVDETRFGSGFRATLWLMDPNGNGETCGTVHGLQDHDTALQVARALQAAWNERWISGDSHKLISRPLRDETNGRS